MTKLRISICVFLAAAVCAGAASAATTPWSHEQDSDLGFRFSYSRALFTRIEGDGNRPSIIWCRRTPMRNLWLERGTIAKAARLINLSAGSWQTQEATTN